MSFTKQDAITFLLGLLVSLALTLGEALLRSADAAADPAAWAVNLLIGLGTAAGRYIVTELTQAKVTPRRPRVRSTAERLDEVFRKRRAGEYKTDEEFIKAQDAALQGERPARRSRK